ncbi:MAG TPA: HAD-IA family hydrolase [Thermoanaerobaculia bacterium]|nr:HAD-IA family hydrolase [Thermoanaerobaculia bacterium]
MRLPKIPILSDLDGTLIDSKESVVAAFRWWAGFRGLSPDIVDHIPFGRTSTDSAEVLAPHLDSAVEGRLLDDMQAELSANVVALPGAMELLSTHEELAIVTSGPRRLATTRLKAARLPIPRHLATPEMWIRGKPDPEPYLKGAALLGVSPEDCIVLEDAPAGVESGVRAGMTVIAILTSHTPEQLSGAAAHIHALTELPAVLAKLGRS